MFVDSIAWSFGTGPYKDRDWGERAVRFAELHITALRTIPGRLAMSVLGKAYGDPKMDFAVKNYWRWRFDPDHDVVPARTKMGTILKEHAEFRQHMRRAAEAQRRGDDPTTHLQKALGVIGKDTIAVNASLRGKKLMEDLDLAKIQEMRKHVGEEAYGLLWMHDEMIEEMMFKGKVKRRARRGRVGRVGR
jgi:hypothetical protein